MLNKLKTYLRENTAYGRSRYLNYLYRYDLNRYFKNSAMERTDAQIVAAKLRLLTHALEKGLSVKEQKEDFGKEKAAMLLSLIQEYRGLKEDPDPQSAELAIAVLGSYANNRIVRGEDVDFIPEEFRAPSEHAGSKMHTKADCIGFAEIAHGRHSIREFSGEPISVEKILAAVELAQTAPSACNRQATHVYACTDPDKMAKIVARHGGLRGFSNPGAILVLTGDLALYQNEYERNTVFVDGGIFLMNLLYALEANDLGACPIIWGAEPDNDSFMYRLLGILESHEIVSLIVVGNYPKGDVKIPCSQRRNTADVFHLIK